MGCPDQLPVDEGSERVPGPNVPWPTLETVPRWGPVLLGLGRGLHLPLWLPEAEARPAEAASART